MRVRGAGGWNWRASLDGRSWTSMGVLPREENDGASLEGPCELVGRAQWDTTQAAPGKASVSKLGQAQDESPAARD